MKATLEKYNFNIRTKLDEKVIQVGFRLIIVG